MLARRIIPCLDVRNGQVVKGVQFKNHRVVGDIVELARLYSAAGADELVFYDITASSERRSVDQNWVGRIAEHIDIPFCVAGGIRSVADARAILYAGADKVSINSPALADPGLIDELVAVFGQQCVVVGIDSLRQDDRYVVCQYTGDESKSIKTIRDPLQWVQEVQARGAGEIVMNCMNQDGVKNGYAISHLQAVRACCKVPLIASGGAGTMAHFAEVFEQADVDGALAASVFHSRQIAIADLKAYLAEQGIAVRQ